MAKIKLPGTDRYIEFELHEPQGDASTLISGVGHKINIETAEFARETADPDTEWAFTAPHLVMFPKDEIHAQEFNAKQFQKFRSLGKPGRPHGHTFSRIEDFAILVLYFEKLGFKQATKAARLYWERNGQVSPTRRTTDQAIKTVRGWVIADFSVLINLVRKRHRLNEALPQKKLRAKRRGLLSTSPRAV